MSRHISAGRGLREGRPPAPTPSGVACQERCHPARLPGDYGIRSPAHRVLPVCPSPPLSVMAAFPVPQRRGGHCWTSQQRTLRESYGNKEFVSSPDVHSSGASTHPTRLFLLAINGRWTRTLHNNRMLAATAAPTMAPQTTTRTGTLLETKQKTDPAARPKPPKRP